jgi:hypothetical protein
LTTTTTTKLLRRRGLLTSVGALLSICALLGCGRPPEGSPEAVADAFCDAYFREANQEKAMQFTAFGATKLLQKEIGDVKTLRESYTPRDASLDVAISRGDRSERGRRVRFDYAIRFRNDKGESVTKHADIELSKVDESWKVVRIGLAQRPSASARPASS